MKSLNNEQLILLAVLEMQLENHGIETPIDVKYREGALGLAVHTLGNIPVETRNLEGVLVEVVRYAYNEVGKEMLMKWLGGYEVIFTDAYVVEGADQTAKTISIFNLNSSLLLTTVVDDGVDHQQIERRVNQYKLNSGLMDFTVE